MIWSKTQISFDLVCDNFPEENQQSVASSKECTQLHTIQARLHLKDLINGCVTAVGKQAVDIHRKSTELICHSCHHNTLLAPIEGSSTCWRENKHAKCVPWFDPAIMENKPVVTTERQLTLSAACIPEVALQTCLTKETINC